MSDALSNQVAALTAILERVERQLDADRKERKAEGEVLNRAVAHDRTNAEMSRRAVSAELTDIRHGQTNVLDRLDRIEPVTNLVTSFQGKMTGAAILLGFIGTLATFAFMFFKDMILEWFR